MMKPLPSVGIVYSILLSDETQRQVSAGTQFPSNSVSFTAGVLNSTSTPNTPKRNITSYYRMFDKVLDLVNYPELSTKGLCQLKLERSICKENVVLL